MAITPASFAFAYTYTKSLSASSSMAFPFRIVIILPSMVRIPPLTIVLNQQKCASGVAPSIVVGSRCEIVNFSHPVILTPQTNLIAFSLKL
jgi:hypothetical protein